MAESPYQRLVTLIGQCAFQKLQQAQILILGVGGVGSWTAEALVRTGIGNLTIVDYDTVNPSNLNRQLLALHSTLGKPKVEVMGERLLDINPELKLRPLNRQLTVDNVPELMNLAPWDYVIDAIDERPPKVAAIIHCLKHHIPIVSSMGAANKLSTDGIHIVDISKTSGCHLARLVRQELRKAGYPKGLRVVCTTEPTHVPPDPPATETGVRPPLGTIVYMPATFGLKCAEEVIGHILEEKTPELRR